MIITVGCVFVWKCYSSRDNILLLIKALCQCRCKNSTCSGTSMRCNCMDLGASTRACTFSFCILEIGNLQSSSKVSRYACTSISRCAHKSNPFWVLTFPIVNRPYESPISIHQRTKKLVRQFYIWSHVSVRCNILFFTINESRDRAFKHVYNRAVHTAAFNCAGRVTELKSICPVKTSMNNLFSVTTNS
jgi:hypothetical protein